MTTCNITFAERNLQNGFTGFRAFSDYAERRHSYYVPYIGGSKLGETVRQFYQRTIKEMTSEQSEVDKDTHPDRWGFYDAFITWYQEKLRTQDDEYLDYIIP